MTQPMTAIGDDITATVDLFHDFSSEDSKSSVYTLHIQFNFETFNAAVLDAKQNKFLGILSYNFEEINDATVIVNRIKQILGSHKVFQQKFRAVKIAYLGHKSTLVPVDIFENTKARDYLDMNYPIEEGEIIRASKFRNLDAILVYSMPSEFPKLLRKYFPKAIINHSCVSLLDTLLNENKRSGETYVYVNVHLYTYEMIIISKGRLVLYNTYEFKTAEDFIYYVLFVYEQFSLNTEEVPLIMMGYITEESELYEITYQYVRNIFFMDWPADNEYDENLEELYPQYFYNLLVL